jgi:Bacterial PH domain
VETGAAGIGGLIALTLAATSTDAPGQVLFGLAAILLFAIVAADLAFRPRLRADRAGIAVRTFGSRLHLPWGEVSELRVDERSRYGLTTRTLELEAGDTLIVLGRRSLGTDPRDVAAALDEFRRAA